MSETWYGGPEPVPDKLSPRDWLRVAARATPLIVLVFGGLAILLLIRLIERPLAGMRRPVTPYVTQGVCRMAFVCLGMGHATRGRPLTGAGAVVANHASWLDIFALNARKRVYFVAKSEVARWPGIGWLARATGTVFIKRDRREASRQVGVFRERLAAGHKLLFFPEGTSTDGQQVLAFKPTLFAAFFDPALRGDMLIQPVTIIYRAPPGADPRFYGWWGGMAFGTHLLATLAARKQGDVTVVYHAPVAVADHADRKSLAKALETQVRAGLAEHRGA